MQVRGGEEMSKSQSLPDGTEDGAKSWLLLSLLQDELIGQRMRRDGRMRGLLLGLGPGAADYSRTGDRLTPPGLWVSISEAVGMRRGLFSTRTY